MSKSGKQILDFSAGWCVGNVGWGRSEIIDRIQEYLEACVYTQPWIFSQAQEKYATQLCDLLPGKLSRAFRVTSGSEAVEMALKCARAATGKQNIVSIDHVYHGHTYGAASVGRTCSESMAPCLPGFKKLPLPDPLRGPDHEEVIKEFRRLVSKDKNIAAFISEPVWTNIGSIAPHPDFYPTIQDICHKNGILFIMDEVATGFGRCGKLFASELWNLSPDIICLGKALTGGYGTMGATVVTEEVFKHTDGIPTYSTFGWLGTDLAAAQATLDTLIKERLWEKGEKVGTTLLGQLKSLEELPFVGQVRGIGLLLGIEIVKNKKSFAPDQNRAEKLVSQLLDAGLLTDNAKHTIFITPPLVLTEAQAIQGAKLIQQILRA